MSMHAEKRVCAALCPLQAVLVALMTLACYTPSTSAMCKWVVRSVAVCGTPPACSHSQVDRAWSKHYRWGGAADGV